MVIIAVVVYVRLHRNKEASAQLNYSGIKGMNLENVPPNYWNTDAIHKIAAAENGYYYITDEDMLVYFDVDSKEEVPVCARPDCAHNSASCDACLKGCVVYNIYYYNGSLYYMPIENGMAKLCRADPDGGSREIMGSCCHVITQVQFIWHSLVIMCMHLIREHILEVMWSIPSR